MLDDLGVDAAYTHDGSDHKELREIAQINPDKSRYRRNRILFVARDPRDTAVSGFFQVGKRHNLEAGSIGDNVRSARHGIEKIAVFNLQWFAAARQMKSIALLRYEDMQRDTEGALRAIGDFIGRRFADSELADVTCNRSFERMRQSEASGEFASRYGGKLRPRDPNDPESFKVRRGKVGGYPDYLSADDIAYCDSVLARLDYWEQLGEAFARYGISYCAGDESKADVN
ncbi:MAG: sulfotransferase domain-containing protein [Alphaproteobacteria bacterium]|nr:sulfotransferase domain-containing protein [Alphaproteobacteria bacterium]